MSRSSSSASMSLLNRSEKQNAVSEPAAPNAAPATAEANFRVQSVEWSPNGDTMLLLDRERFCMCFMGEDGQLTGAPGGE